MPTVTDANLVLGYVPADYFLGGEMTLDVQRRVRRCAAGGALGMERSAVAQSMFTTVNAIMANLITEVCTKSGHDMRNTLMIAGGGGGPIHAGCIAETLGIPMVMVPRVAALYSAFGMFAMDLGQEYARSFVGRVASIDLDALNRVYAEMEAEAAASFRAHGVDAKDVVLKRTADMRYVGQFHEVEAEMANGKIGRKDVDGAADFFARKHQELYTFAMPWKAVEILTLRLKASTPNAPFALPQVAQGGADPAAAFKRRRSCRFNGKDIDTPVYDGEKVVAGNVIDGPAIIEETTTTVVIPATFVCSVDKYKNYVLTRS